MRRVPKYFLLFLVLCPSVLAQDWRKPLQDFCKRNHFFFNPDFSDRNPLGFKVELDAKGKILDISKPHAGVSEYSEQHPGKGVNVDETFFRSDELTVNGLFSKMLNIKDFRLKAKHKVFLRIREPQTISMLVIPKAKSNEFQRFPVVDEVLKIGELDLRICSDDPEDKKKAIQKSGENVQVKDESAKDGSAKDDSAKAPSDCGKSLNVTAQYGAIGGSFQHTTTEQYIVIGQSQYIGVKANYYDLGEVFSAPGSLKKGTEMDFGGVWIGYRGADKTDGDSIYSFRVNVRPAPQPTIKQPTVIRGFGSDNPNEVVVPIRPCGEHCLDMSLRGLQSSRPFRVSDLWGELTVISESLDDSVKVTLTTMNLQTRKAKEKKAALAISPAAH